MPQKKGAPMRAAKYPAAAKGAKPGSKSPKHRGHRPDDAAAPGAPRPAAKKARWSSDDRVARGRASERPRGGEARPERGDSPRDRTDGQSSRPNWEPRPKQSRFERSEKRTGRGERGPVRPARDDRPRRDHDARPRRDEADARPRREYGTDRPRRDNVAERPRREYGSDRPRRDNVAERPRREYGSDRPRRDHAAERPQRRFDDSPKAYQPTDDVVLERLQAQAIEATDGEGATFADLGLGDNIVRVLEEQGATTPFPIQAGTIPQVLAGRDVLGRGRTGSGKTIAFGAPLVERLLRMQAGSAERRKPGRSPRALIVAPTRELALQIDRTVQPIARSVGLFTTQIYGGVPYARQLGALDRGVDIVIGTPGRIQDLAAQGRLDLSQVTITVLDEADHMCELGFLEPIQDILRYTGDGGQKLLFSATLDAGVANLVDEFLVDPSVHEVAGEDQASSTIEHRVLVLDQRDKLEVLAELAGGPGKKLVFARTRSFADQLADFLDDADVSAESIHGDLNQSRRQRALEKFSRGRVQALVATDVAARGIHVDDVDLVIQADAPDEYKSYLHRSGRTGRAGKSGVVVTLVPRNRRRRVEELLQRAEITAEWTTVRPGDAIIRQLAGA